MKIYNDLVIYDDYVVLDGNTYDSVMGKHCIYIPEIETKIVLSFQGHIESTEWELGKRIREIKNGTLNPLPGFTVESLYSIVNEYRIFHLLSEKKMSPTPRQYVYIKDVQSKIFTSHWYRENNVWTIKNEGTWYSDKKGMYGYVIDDANRLEPGQYNFDKFKTLFIDTGRIKANPGALGDLEKKDGNMINNYLIDVRRSLFAMMQLQEELNIDILLKINYEQGTIS